MISTPFHNQQQDLEALQVNRKDGKYIDLEPSPKGIGAFVTPSASLDEYAAQTHHPRTLSLQRLASDNEPSIAGHTTMELLPSPSMFRDIWKDRDKDTEYVNHDNVPADFIDNDIQLHSPALRLQLPHALPTEHHNLAVDSNWTDGEQVPPSSATPAPSEVSEPMEATATATDATDQVEPQPLVTVQLKLDQRLSLFGHWGETRPSHWLKVWQRVCIFVAGMEASANLSATSTNASTLVLGGLPFARELFDRYYGNAERGISGVVARALAGKLDSLWSSVFPMIQFPVTRLSEHLLTARVLTRPKLLRYLKDYIVGEIVSVISPAYRRTLLSITNALPSSTITTSVPLYDVLDRTLIELWSLHEDMRIVGVKRRKEAEELTRLAQIQAGIEPTAKSYGSSGSLERRAYPGAAIYQPLSFLVFILFGAPSGPKQCWPLFRTDFSQSQVKNQKQPVSSALNPVAPSAGAEVPVSSSSGATTIAPVPVPAANGPTNSIKAEVSSPNMYDHQMGNTPFNSGDTDQGLQDGEMSYDDDDRGTEVNVTEPQLNDHHNFQERKRLRLEEDEYEEPRAMVAQPDMTCSEYPPQFSSSHSAVAESEIVSVRKENLPMSFHNAANFARAQRLDELKLALSLFPEDEVSQDEMRDFVGRNQATDIAF